MPPSDRPDWADEQPPEPARRLLATLEEYAACVTELVRRARLELLIFDPDGVQLALDQRERIEALFQFLRGAPVRRLSVIVHHARHLEANCPRFLRLVGQFAGQIDVRVTCGEARRAEDCFI